MVQIESFYITLDNPLAAYYAGQTVTGKVYLKIEDELNIEGIFLNIEGTASVKWTEKRPYDANLSRRKLSSRTVKRKDSHTYFKFEIILQRVAEEVESMTISPGEYEYPFSQALPSDLPSSFEGSFGYIRYTCSSHISIPWRFDPKCKTAFTILELIDLNTLPGIEKPCSGQSTRTLGMCCFKSGNISASMSLNKQGYVPGENVVIQAEVNNSTDADISETAATLICVITYRSGIHSRLETKDICHINHGVVQPQSRDQWVDQMLLIPSVPPTRVGAAMCRLINLEYFIKFSVDPSGLLANDLDFTVPVTIGSVPLVADFDRFTNSTEATDPSSNNVIHPTMLGNYPNLPSPMYKESFGGRVDIKEDDDDDHAIGELSYVPRYLYYTQGSTRLSN